MKKILSIILVTILVFAMCAPFTVMAANNPFQRMTVTEDNVEGGTNGTHDTMENPAGVYDAGKLFHLYWDTDPDTWHAAGVTIAFLDPYGIGYCHTNSVVYIEDLDFGPNGANKVAVSLTNAATEDMGSLNVYLDVNPIIDRNAQPIGTTVCGTTDGFEGDYAEDFAIDVDIPGGIHTVYFMFTSNTVGSFFGAEFTEAPAVEVEVIPEVVDEPDEPAVTAPAPAPDTGDAGLFMTMLTLAVLGSAVVLTKKAKNRA